MKHREMISVVVPVYNLAEYIERCVQSILNQSYSNLEIIIVDDGSTDGSAKIIDDIQDKEYRVKAIHQNNYGVTRARLTGVKAASGQWIGFVDGDDIIDFDMYEHLLSNAYMYNADISHCGYKKTSPNDVKYYYNTGKLLIQDNKKGVKDLIDGAFIEPSLCNKLYKFKLFHDLIEEHKMDITIKNTEDLLMNYYLFCGSALSVYEDFCPYHYIVRGGSASNSLMNVHKIYDPIKVLKIIKKEIKDDLLLKAGVNSRIAGRLINLSTFELRPFGMKYKKDRKQARKELWFLLPELICSKCSYRVKFLSMWAAIWPWSYILVHSFYSSKKRSE